MFEADGFAELDGRDFFAVITVGGGPIDVLGFALDTPGCNEGSVLAVDRLVVLDGRGRRLVLLENSFGRGGGAKPVTLS